MLQSTECLGRKDKNPAVMVQLICSYQTKRSNWQWSRAVDAIIDNTSNTSDRHEEFVYHWIQGKFSWLEMVFLDCSASNQQTTK